MEMAIMIFGWGTLKFRPFGGSGCSTSCRCTMPHQAGPHSLRTARQPLTMFMALEVFSFLQQLYRQGYFPKEQMKGKSDIFLAQKIAVRFTGPWSIRQIEAYKREDFDYSFGSVPVPDDHEGPVYTYCDPKNIVIFNTCRNPQLAWSFLETMLSDEADLDFLTKSSQLPRRKDLVTNEMFHEYFRDNPGMIPFAEQSRYLKGVDSSPYMKEVLDLISQEYEACVVFGKKTPEKAIKDAAQAVNLLYLK